MTALRQRTLDLLAEWIPMHSVAGDAAGLRQMAELLCDHLRGMGAEIVSTPGEPPLIHARIARGFARRLLLYNMYDVMPADDAGWSVPPFVGGVVDTPDGPAFIGRGAENNKGPLAGMLVALAALLDGDALPADVEILIDGAEESGSAGLRSYLAGPAAPVPRCVAALFPSFCEYGGGRPRVYLGSKGIAHGTIRVPGPARPIHSSNAPWIANPAMRLARACAALPELGGGVLPEAASALLDDLAARFDAAAELRLRHSEAFSIPGDTRSRLAHVLTATSLNIADLRTEPPGGRAVIPASASARFDLRLPPGVDPESGFAAIRRALPPDAELSVEDCYPGHSFLAGPAVLALLDSYHRLGTVPDIWPWAIGAMPGYAFAPVADSFLIGGLGHGGNAHGPDEFVTLAGVDRYLASLLEWLPATVAAAEQAMLRGA